MVRGTGDPASRGPWAARLTDGLSDCSGLRSGRSERGGAVSGAMASGECSRRGLPTAGRGQGPGQRGAKECVRGSNYSGFREPSFGYVSFCF